MSAPVVALTGGRKRGGLQRNSDGSVKLLTRPQKPKQPAKTTKKYVKRQIDANKETHEIVFTGFADSPGSGYSNHQFPGLPQWNNLSNTGDLMRLFPNIDQGDNRENRTGSKIKLQNINCKFHFHIPPATDPTANPTAGLCCRLLVLSPKQFTKWTEFVTEWSSGANLGRKYLRNGEAQTYFQGDLMSLEFPVNTALFTTHYDRRFQLHRGKLIGDDSSGLARMPEVAKTINLNLKVKNKVVQYADSGLSVASNYSPFAILLYAPMNGDITTTSPGPITGNVITRPTWKDM
jgi:hypothetical protein